MAADGGTGLRRGLAALAVLADADGAGRGGLGVLDVARRLGVDKSQASRTLRALAEDGPGGARSRHARVPARAAGVRLRGGRGRAAGPAQRPGGARAARDGARRARAPQRARRAERAHAADGVAAARRAGRGLAGAHRARLLHGGRPRAARRPRRGAVDGAAGRRSAGTARAEHRRRASPRSPPASQAAAERGYHVADEELEPGLCAVAAPVRRFDGRIVAALNVSGPAFRFAARLDAAGGEVAAAAVGLSAELLEAPPVVAMTAT